MKSDLPRTAAFLQQNSVAHDGLWVHFAESLERENAALREAARRVLLDVDDDGAAERGDVAVEELRKLVG